MLRNLNRQFTRGRILGTPNCGVLGSEIAPPNTDGLPGYCYNDLTLPDDDEKNICGRITTWPATGTLIAYEDTSFDFTPAGDGVESFQYQLYVDGVAVGDPAIVMLTSGDGSTVNGIIGNAAAAGSQASLARTITAVVGGAVATGSPATFPRVIVAAPGDAAATGGTASVSGSLTISAAVGNASATGATAAVTQDRILGADTGDATAAGVDAAIVSTATISATVGAATAAGAQADVAYTSAAQGGAIAIMRALLVAHAPLTALVPAPRVFAGIIPQGALLPAISIQEISGTENSTVARLQATTQNRSRVQVTVVTKSLADQKRIISAAKLGPGTHRGTFASYKTLSVMPESVGPDMNNLDDDGIYEQSRDFMVTFVEAN